MEIYIDLLNSAKSPYTDLNLSMAIGVKICYAAVIGPGMGYSYAWTNMGKIIFTDMTQAEPDEIISRQTLMNGGLMLSAEDLTAALIKKWATPTRSCSPIDAFSISKRYQRRERFFAISYGIKKKPSVAYGSATATAVPYRLVMKVAIIVCIQQYNKIKELA